MDWQARARLARSFEDLNALAAEVLSDPRHASVTFSLTYTRELPMAPLRKRPVMTASQLKTVASLARLSMENAWAAHLVLVEGKTQTAAAAATGLSRQSVGNTVQRALRVHRGLQESYQGPIAQDDGTIRITSAAITG